MGTGYRAVFNYGSYLFDRCMFKRRIHKEEPWIYVPLSLSHYTGELDCVLGKQCCSRLSTRHSTFSSFSNVFLQGQRTHGWRRSLVWKFSSAANKQYVTARFLSSECPIFCSCIRSLTYASLEVAHTLCDSPVTAVCPVCIWPGNGQS